MDKKENCNSEIRFGFGENWLEFEGGGVKEKEIVLAQKSLQDWLGLDDLQGKTFLDIGSGSGLFSLAAREMGAEKVYSIDYDEQSVECTKRISMRETMPHSWTWTIERGNVLDRAYMKNFYNSYDIVYSWGVLHHTGNMMLALEQAGKCVKENGILFISIYNDQGIESKIWKKVKKVYNQVSERKKRILLVFSSLYLYGYKRTGMILKSSESKNLKTERGMNEYTDLIDWVGGYPFEYAAPEKIITFYLNRGFELKKLMAPGRKYGGCNQYLFVKRAK